MRFLFLVLLAGCSSLQNDGPYIGYRHNSQPLVANDGWDTACIGNRVTYDKQLETKIGICKIARYPGAYAEVHVDYFFVRTQ